MALVLGSTPEELRVTLVRGADFVSTLRRKDGSNWPAGSQVLLEFIKSTPPNVEWSATISTSTVVWNVDQVEVDALIAVKARAVKLWYVEGGLRLLWAQGEIEVV